ncbi:MAG TPA: vanadium-dependent haloperoxidase [Gemmatimonadaceae bacterium]|nr:vanadium-dependent haloperoxidase [Gemmatimonadaceae bacterium]
MSLAVLAAAACSDGPTSGSPVAARSRMAAAAAAATATTVNPVIQWNRIVLQIVRTPGAQSPLIHSTWDFAILHAAIYDAVNAIDGTHRPYAVRVPNAPRDASEDAAAIAAAHEALVNLYPSFTGKLDSAEQQSLAAIPDGKPKTDGVRLGRGVADRILALRANDGSHVTPPTFLITDIPGRWEPMPPNFQQQPQFTHWGQVTPFVLQSALQFPLGPPPALTSRTYIDAFNEVKAIGRENGTVATADQILVGRFWNGNIQDFWNEITQTAALGHHLTTAESARVFALLNLSLADAVIAFYKSKYQYALWRPVTAIREAHELHNPALQADTGWLPLAVKTAPDPSYPGAHASTSWAGATVLMNFFAEHDFVFQVTSESLPNAQRSFTSYAAAADEATNSRIFAGQHFRFDENAGHQQGFQVADFIVDNFLTRSR